jgi:colicin import membrane protein
VDPVERSQYSFALATSLVGHGIMVILMLVSFKSAGNFSSGIVYSVTIEGGKQIGGISQLAQSDKKASLAPPKNVSDKSEELEQKKNPPDTKEPEVKAEDAEVSLAEKRKEEERKKREAERTEQEKKKAQERKKKEEEDKKKKAEDAKKKASAQPADVSKDYQKALQRYLGESTEAGGKGFGAAKLGGSGMGGGVLRPPEFFTYRQILRNRVKSGWKWFDTSSALMANVTFSIAEDGTLSNVRIAQSSGNREYDDSVLRAVYKASPVPPPPQSVYEFFRDVSMTFDPRE